MSFLIHPFVYNQQAIVEKGKRVLVVDTPIELDCNKPGFNLLARRGLEREQERVERKYGYDVVRLNQI